MRKITEWLIRKLGGYTGEDLREVRQDLIDLSDEWRKAVNKLKAQDRVTLVEGSAILHSCYIHTLVLAPDCGATLINTYVEVGGYNV